MQQKHKGKITVFIQAICIVPLLLLGFVIMYLSYVQLTKAVTAQIENELQIGAFGLQSILDATYPGDYCLVGDSSYQIYKGETDITRNYKEIDHFKEATGLDVTLFYQDTRILTTVYDEKGVRIVGTAAPAQIMEEVYNASTPHFYPSVYVNYTEYYAYYTPLFNSDGTRAGMLFVGKSTASVQEDIQQSVYPLLTVIGIAILVIVLGIFLYTGKFAGVLTSICRFLSEVSTGNLNAQLDTGVTSRNDEFGEIGRNVVNMQHSLRHVIEQDTLTELLNRRFGDRKLKQIVEKAGKTGTPFSVAIGDIDFFKKVNDTYGHDGGDLVLKEVAAVLRNHMHSNGFVARWGGEEFLLVFDHLNMFEAKEELEKILADIRALRVPYGDTEIAVTMTFGISEGNTTDINALIKTADDKLYNGKTGGRNQIVI